MIELKDVSKTYGKRRSSPRKPAISGVNLKVERGEYISITGESGSGKSTLINILGCLDRPTSGTYRLMGLQTETLSASGLDRMRQSTIGFVFQSFHLLERLTAVENVELALTFAGTEPRYRREMAERALCEVGLSQRLWHRPGEMSGGQQQRTAIARAIVRRPPLLLADEPTGNLDARAAREIMALFRQLSAGGCTIVLITHDERAAMEAGRRLRVIGGRLEAL
ncbi:MAG: ABC transporter ATP-binding protein [Eubacteriales bacterium]|nr:ABC transporter ATP-binding protein [Eubacteriales bacterium]MDD3880705.1 ABC transporter ATP-binding protein [Eubacteriales bacterium]MDD4511661.1 ABC transporter ATP-binding protein [Eubacteriales bacterium]